MQRHDSDPVLSKKALMEGFSLDSKILPKQHSEPGPMLHERKPKFLIEGPGKIRVLPSDDPRRSDLRNDFLFKF